MKMLTALIAPLALGACAIVPAPDSTPPQPQGYAVPLGVPVKVGDLVVTPTRLVEDSRCPMNARCIWAGRVVVATRITGAGWADNADLTLGQEYGTHGRVVMLSAVRPEKTTTQQQPLEPGAYRFNYELR